MTEISIIGAGVAGLTTAKALLDRGAKVRLFERGDGVGPHACSWWAGGMLAPFCEGESAEEPVVRLGTEAAAWWHNATGGVSHNGTLVVTAARDQSDLRRFARRTSDFVDVDVAEIARLEPDLEGRFSKGLFFGSEAHLTPRVALASLRQGLLDAGVVIEQAEVDPQTLTGPVVDARGYTARDALPQLRGVKGEMAMLHCPDITLSRPVRLLHPRIPLYVVPRGNGIFMLGATMIESASGPNVTARSLLELLSAAYALNPAFGEAEVIEIGVDNRPAFPDNLPRITREGDILRVNGLFRHGFLLAPAMARMVAEILLDNATPEVMHERAA
ncbi:FAD-dependent oxidoreductase [Algirhabdus cladophorae]|uniref:FAD-dependent oxidoreductase n=1 Tax=Algirhabdus cladophorae TaxID=3377108 RepID=UPI003B848822